MRRLWILVPLLLLLSGCRDYRDPNELMIVTGVAVDLGEEGQTRVTAEILSFAQGKDTEPKSHLLRGAGRSLYEAVNDILKQTGKALYWQHAAVFILGRAYAEHGTRELFDYIANDRQLRLSLDLAVSGLETAEEIYRLDPVDRSSMSIAVEKRIEEAQKLGFAIRESAGSAMNTALEGRRDFAVPLVRMGPDGAVEVSGSAVFHDGRLCGTIDTPESQCVLLLDGKLPTMDMAFDTPVLSCAVSLGKLSCDCAMEGRSANLAVSAEYEVMMCVESKATDRQTRMETIETLCRERLCFLLDAANRHFAQMGCDLFGWGERFWRADPDAWESERLDPAHPPELAVRVRLAHSEEGLSGQAIIGEGG